MSDVVSAQSSQRLIPVAGGGLVLLYGALGAVVVTHESVPVSTMLWSALLAGGLIALSLIDFATLRLPNIGTLGLAISGLFATMHQAPDDLASHVAAGLAGFAFLLLLNASYRALRGRDGIGGGDAKLLAAAGTWTGPMGLVSVLLWSTLSALLAFLVLSLVGREVGRQSQLPFGPFLALAIWITWCFGPLQAAS